MCVYVSVSVCVCVSWGCGRAGMAIGPCSVKRTKSVIKLEVSAVLTPLEHSCSVWGAS